MVILSEDGMSSVTQIFLKYHIQNEVSRIKISVCFIVKSITLNYIYNERHTKGKFLEGLKTHVE